MQTTEFYSYYMKFADLGFALPSKKVQTQYNFPSSFMQMFIKSTLALQNAISRCFLTTVKLGNLHLFGLELQDDIRFFKFILTLRSCPPEKKNKTKQKKFKGSREQFTYECFLLPLFQNESSCEAFHIKMS